MPNGKFRESYCHEPRWWPKEVLQGSSGERQFQVERSGCRGWTNWETQRSVRMAGRLGTSSCWWLRLSDFLETFLGFQLEDKKDPLGHIGEFPSRAHNWLGKGTFQFLLSCGGDNSRPS